MLYSLVFALLNGSSHKAKSPVSTTAFSEYRKLSFFCNGTTIHLYSTCIVDLALDPTGRQVSSLYNTVYDTYTRPQ